ncbi:magnesium transporter CorA family protein [uncultured Limosilactobacillus sp.]|uniref:magnesium transporter CorA family protein n=1 Tax=uncultured Limosilactobacillus sp. TaxID=2837629 RepID=UPI0025F579FE|nr:magnesium transporter CorA family protein [uncultured Limosilactobacillus sp.]
MLQTFTINGRHLQVTTGQGQSSTILLLSSPTPEEIAELCTQFNLDPTIFDRCNSAEEVSRFQLLESKQLTNPHLLVVFDFNFGYQHIEEQLTPAILIFDQDHLIICTQNSAVSFEELQQAVAEHDPVHQLVFHLVDAWQQQLNAALQNFEDEIDRLDQASRDTTIKNTELRALTELMRQLVYFEHTVNDQTTTLKALVDSPMARNISDSLKLKIETSQRRLSKAIHIYRDAVESLSSLYTAMMDNHLNHLMKFLDSTGLVIGIAALLSGLMGMNVGGMPWESSKYGFWIIIGLAGLLSLIASLYLHRRSYND